jgi:MoaA/NifB/PqqE/SkfB family radical SAM enzyme
VRLPGFLEVELGSYCNRRCGWCPNAYSERGQAHRAMEESTWEALLDDLHQHHFRGWFAFHNYNEPLADPHLLARVSRAKERIPGAKLELHTNGDLLDRELLDALVMRGVELVRVTLYPSNAAAFDPPEPHRARRFLARLGLRDEAEVSKASKLELHARLAQTNLVVRVPRIEAYTTRAGNAPLTGLKATVQRTTPCLLPFHSAAIDYLGNLKLCCELFDSTAPGAEPYVIGNVAKTPFTTLWQGEQMNALRRQLMRADFAGLAACQGCAHATPRHIERAVQPLVRQLEKP